MLFLQTVEEIAEIVKQAQTPPAGPAGWDQDEYIGVLSYPFVCPAVCCLCFVMLVSLVVGIAAELMGWS